MNIIKPKAISGFYENLPEYQIIEDRFKKIIEKNYSNSGFTPLDTPGVERLEVLTSKGADDSEIYGLHRIHTDNLDDVTMGLRFDLTVPLARYIGQYEGELVFPFRRQHIARVYRGERPQKWRYREFYQADIDIIGNGNLPLFADVEVLSTIYNALKELDFGEFVIHINNKKFLVGLLKNFGVAEDKIVKTISIIDKKDKMHFSKLKDMFLEVGLSEDIIESIKDYIDFCETSKNDEILEKYSSIKNTDLEEGLRELKYVYENLKSLGIEEKNLKIDLTISRGLNYYTGTVFETFAIGSDSKLSISSGGRYDNLVDNFSKNSYPGVGGSIGLSRLFNFLKDTGKLEVKSKTTSKILILNMGEKYIGDYLEILKKLRLAGISSELYLDGEAKLQKQFKYAENKKIPLAIIAGEDELSSGTLALKDLEKREQIDVKTEKLIETITNILN